MLWGFYGFAIFSLTRPSTIITKKRAWGDEANCYLFPKNEVLQHNSVLHVSINHAMLSLIESKHSNVWIWEYFKRAIAIQSMKTKPLILRHDFFFCHHQPCKKLVPQHPMCLLVISVLLICLASTAFADHENNLITKRNVTVLAINVCLLACLHVHFNK